MEPENYRVMLDAAHTEWKRWQEAYFDLANRAAAGAQIDDTEFATVRMELDRALNDFMSLAQQLQEQVHILRKRAK